MRFARTRTIAQLEVADYPWIGCDCGKGTWVPFKMIWQKILTLDTMTLTSSAPPG